MSTESLGKRIDAGVSLLDEKRPGWWKRIKLSRLDLGSVCDCVVGQEFELERYYSSWESALRKLGHRGQGISLGFNAGSGEGFLPLNEAWRERIRDIRKERRR